MRYTHFFLSYKWANQILAKSIFRRHDTTKIKLNKQDNPAAYHKSNQYGLVAKSTLVEFGGPDAEVFWRGLKLRRQTKSQSTSFD